LQLKDVQTGIICNWTCNRMCWTCNRRVWTGIICNWNRSFGRYRKPSFVGSPQPTSSSHHWCDFHR